MGAVDVSREGGFLHRSVFGGAARVKDPIHSGTTSYGMLRGVKEELAGGMASGLAIGALAIAVGRRQSLSFVYSFPSSAPSRICICIEVSVAPAKLPCDDAQSCWYCLARGCVTSGGHSLWCEQFEQGSHM